MEKFSCEKKFLRYYNFYFHIKKKNAYKHGKKIILQKTHVYQHEIYFIQHEFF